MSIDPTDIPPSASKKEVRKQSFATASLQLQTYGNSITLAAFFHIGNDIISCHLQVSNWNEPCDPWYVHVKESPFYLFIRNLLEPSQIFDLLQNYTENSLVIIPTRSLFINGSDLTMVPVYCPKLLEGGFQKL